MNWKQLISDVLSYLVPAVIIPLFVRYVLPVLLPTTKHAFDWMKAQADHVQNQYVRGLLDRVIALSGQKVLAFEQTFIEDLKTKVENGRIDPKDIPAILREEKVKFLLALKAEASSQNIWEDVKKLAFGGDEPAFMKWVDGVVESQVAQLPPSGLQTQKNPTVPSAVQIAESGTEPAAAVVVPQPAAA